MWYQQLSSLKTKTWWVGVLWPGLNMPSSLDATHQPSHETIVNRHDDSLRLIECESVYLTYSGLWYHSYPDGYANFLYAINARWAERIDINVETNQIKFAMFIGGEKLDECSFSSQYLNVNNTRPFVQLNRNNFSQQMISIETPLFHNF